MSGFIFRAARGEIGLDPALCSTPAMVITAKSFHDYPAAYFDGGVAVAIVKTGRNHPLALPPSIKGTDFLNNILAKIEADEARAFEGIMLNWQDYVAEGTISNIFMVKKGALYTPRRDAGILEGVTRGLVFHRAAREKIIVNERLLRPSDFLVADECFVTNSTMEIMPVTKIDKKTAGAGRPGRVTAALIQAYKKEGGACLRTQTS